MVCAAVKKMPRPEGVLEDAADLAMFGHIGGYLSSETGSQEKERGTRESSKGGEFAEGQRNAKGTTKVV